MSALILGAGFAWAGEVPASVSSKVQKGIPYPIYLKEKNESAQARVSFVIREDGTVQVLEINTGDKALRKHVESTLSNMQFDKGSFEPGQVINMSITFKMY